MTDNKKSRQPMTTERFVAMAVEIYGGKYDYTHSECSTVKDKVCVVCRVDGHGPWWPKVNNHLSGKSGCPKCAGNQRLGASTFISRAVAIHKAKYTYPADVVYKNNSTPVEILCPYHGTFTQTPMAHLAGQGCPTCSGKGVLGTEKFIELSKSIHGDKFDYSLAVFKTTTDKVTLKCKVNGHVFEQDYGVHIYQKSGCPECAGNATLGIEGFISRAVNVHGDRYVYSLVKYSDSKTPVSIICKKHGEFLQRPSAHINRKQGCPKCAKESLVTPTPHYIARAIQVHGAKYIYSKTIYTGYANNLVVTCPEHGDWFVSSRNHVGRGTGCPKCAGLRQLTNDEFIVKALSVHSGEYSYEHTKYKNHHSKVVVTCGKHGDFMQEASSHLQGRGCPLCANVGPSKPQLEIHEFLSQHTEALLEHKFEGSQKRYDIYLPAKKLAVEYHGLYWHSSRTQARDTTDAEKYEVAAKNGVRTITVFQDEWHFQPDTVKRTLLSAMGLLPRIFARKCEVRALVSSEVRDFYMDNHIQTIPRSHIHFGLVNDNTIVACMSFAMLRSSRRNKDTRHWELTRYAATHTVVGGASKLLSAFRSLKVADRVTSYSDVRMFSGNMYAQLGFTRTHQTPPDYYYVNTNKHQWRIHKAKFQKKHLVRLFPGCDVEGKTEREICEENGYYQVYDCGKVRWDLEL